VTAGLPPVPPEAAAGPELIRAIPLRRPGRWVAAIVILAIVVSVLYGAVTNANYQWSTYRAYLFDSRISSAAWNTCS